MRSLKTGPSLLVGLLDHALGLLILMSAFTIHEYGHLREFQKRGISVEEFSIGIGPRLYHYQTASFVVSVRIIPLMAYVKPTEEGHRLFRKNGSLQDKLIVRTAGVRNNFAAGLFIVILLQVLGWMRGNLSLRELLTTIVVTPLKMILRFLSYIVGCCTLGHVNLTEKVLLSTGGLTPPPVVKRFIFWNLALGLVNLAPIIPFDGGYTLQDILTL